MPNECEFLNSVNERRAVIAIIGLGNTGLPVAQGYVDRGFPVHGIDIDAARIDELRSGRSYLSYLSDQEIQTLLAGSFSVGTDFRAVADADVVIVCVPTPLRADGEADLSSVRTAFDAIAPYASRGVLVMLQSTVPPGTTDVLATRLAAKSGLTLGPTCSSHSPPNGSIPPTRRAGRSSPRPVSWEGLPRPARDVPAPCWRLCARKP